MKSHELLSQIKNLLGMEDIQLDKLQLENGTVLEAESFDNGKEVFILSDDQKISLPVGNYLLQDGRELIVKEEGLIDSIQEVKAEDEMPEEEEEVEMEYVTREEFRNEMDELKKKIDEMMDYKDKDKEEMASQVATEIAVEMSKAPATEPIKHTPEEDSQVEHKFKFAQNRKTSTLDRVMANISNK